MRFKIRATSNDCSKTLKTCMESVSSLNSIKLIRVDKIGTW